MESPAENTLAQWTASECPFTIEYSARTLDDIRLAVVDAFHSLQRGGVEIGGLLLGRFDTGRLTIVESAAMECEHAFGPSFTLSTRDLARLEKLIGERNGSDLRPVGWYHSHTRSHIHLSEGDLEIHRRFFPDPRQVALVLRPHAFEPVRAGFFFRESDGSIHASASYLEFQIDPQYIRPAPRTNAPATPFPTRRIPLFQAGVVDIEQETVRPEPETGREPAAAPPVSLRAGPGSRETPLHPSPPAEGPSLPSAEPLQLASLQQATTGSATAAAGLSATTAAIAPAWNAGFSANCARTAACTSGFDRARIPSCSVGSAAPEFPCDSAGEIAAVGRIVSVLLGLTLGAGAFETRDRWLPRFKELIARSQATSAPPAPGPVAPSLDLTTIDSAGQLLIRWNHQAPAIRNSIGALLLITDEGVSPQAVGLDEPHLQSGSFTYARQSGRVDVRLTVHQPGGVDVSEVATFLGKPPDSIPPMEDATARKKQDDLVQEAARLRTDLAKQAARNKKLERSIEDMRTQLKKVQQRKRMENQSPDSVKK